MDESKTTALFKLHAEIERVYRMLAKELCDCGSAHKPMQLNEHMPYCDYKKSVTPQDGERSDGED